MYVPRARIRHQLEIHDFQPQQQPHPSSKDHAKKKLRSLFRDSKEILSQRLLSVWSCLVVCRPPWPNILQPNVPELNSRLASVNTHDPGIQLSEFEILVYQTIVKERSNECEGEIGVYITIESVEL